MAKQPFRDLATEINYYIDRVLAKSLSNRDLFLCQELDSEFAEWVVRHLLILATPRARSKRPIDIYMDCPGGEENAGLAIMSGIEVAKERGYEVNIYVTGDCCSMAPVVLQAATNRYSYKNARFMIHESWEEGMDITVSQAEDEAKRRRSMEARLVKIMAERTNLSAARWLKLYKRKDFYFWPEQALEWGLIDEVIG